MKRETPATYFDGAAREAAQAIDAGDIARVRGMIEGGLPIDQPGRKQVTLLWYAMFKKNFEAVKALTALGEKLDEHMVEGLGTPLHAALVHRDSRYLQAMLDGGLSPDYQNADGTNLLQRAMLGSDALDRVKLLVERGADVNLHDSIGGIALDEAVDSMHPEIAIYLVEHGSRVDNVLTNGSSTAWAVHQTLERLRPGASAAAVTDISLDGSGKPTERDTTPPPVSNQDEATNKLRVDFERLRDLMVARGVTWPPEAPEAVRARRKAQGLEVAE